MTPEQEAKFMALVEKDVATGCWNWQGCFVNRDAHGRFYVGQSHGKRSVLIAHTVAFKHWVSPCIHGKMVARKCGNRRCVNPAHMYLTARGDAKLSDAQVIDIRRRYRDGGVFMSDLAREYNVDLSLISRIVNHKRRKGRKA